jgi:F-type H+-transporting ATPase subunit delta
VAETVSSIKERILALEGVREAVVISAEPLSEEIVAELRRKLESGGRKVRLQQRVDPSLIGGLVVRIGDSVYDGSLRSRLGRVMTQNTLGESSSR